MKRYKSLFKEAKNNLFNIKMEIEFAKRAKSEHARMGDMETSKYWGDIAIYLLNYLKLQNIKQVKKDVESGSDAAKYAANVILSNIKE